MMDEKLELVGLFETMYIKMENHNDYVDVDELAEISLWFYDERIKEEYFRQRDLEQDDSMIKVQNDKNKVLKDDERY
jgi:hypothetical protein